jgi:hypothetical protein
MYSIQISTFWHNIKWTSTTLFKVHNSTLWQECHTQRMVVITVLNVGCETLVVCLWSFSRVPTEEYISNKHTLPELIRNCGINLCPSVNGIKFYYNYAFMHNLNFTLKWSITAENSKYVWITNTITKYINILNSKL